MPPAVAPPVSFILPCIGFDYKGQLLPATYSPNPPTTPQDIFIPLAQGSIFYARDANGAPSNQPADVRENPSGNTLYDPSYPNNNYNQIHIDWLTGRARVEKPQIQ